MSTLFAMPTGPAMELELAPRLESWNRYDDPDQVALRKFVAHLRERIGPVVEQTSGPLAFRLDVGLAEALDPLWERDLDNYLFPIARELPDRVVSVWGTKGRSTASFVRLEPAAPTNPSTAWRQVTVPRSSSGEGTWKQAVWRAAQAEEALPEGPVALQLAFAGGSDRSWTSLWKPSIDALDPLLGRTYPGREWNPQDGRIVRLGFHRLPDDALGDDVSLTVCARPADETWPEVDWLASMDGARREAYHEQYRAKLRLRAERAALELRPPAGRRRLVRQPAEPPSSTEVLEFSNNDDEYLRWVAQHADGFVLNIQRSLNTRDARLHRTLCRTINGTPARGNVWTGPYIKICADDIGALDRWAAQVAPLPITRCRTCRPPAPGDVGTC
jgi:hypothetical protein